VITGWFDLSVVSGFDGLVVRFYQKKRHVWTKNFSQIKAYFSDIYTRVGVNLPPSLLYRDIKLT